MHVLIYISFICLANQPKHNRPLNSPTHQGFYFAACLNLRRLGEKVMEIHQTAFTDSSKCGLGASPTLHGRPTLEVSLSGFTLLFMLECSLLTLHAEGNHQFTHTALVRVHPNVLVTYSSCQGKQTVTVWGGFTHSSRLHAGQGFTHSSFMAVNAQGLPTHSSSLCTENTM